MQLFKSKKFWMAVTGIIVVVISDFVPSIDQADLTKIITLIVAAIAGQAAADWGKESKK